MNMNDFQQHAVSTLAITNKSNKALAHRGFGLTGEAGRVAEILKKVIRDKDGKPDTDDIAQIKKRLGDIMYYAATLAEYFDLDLDAIAKQNVEQSTAFKQSRQQ